MKDFDQRWQHLAQEARRATEADLPALPFGFTTRVLAQARQTTGEVWVEVLNGLGLRAVLATAVVFGLSAGYAFSGWFESRIEAPALDRAVTMELSWP